LVELSGGSRCRRLERGDTPVTQIPVVAASKDLTVAAKPIRRELIGRRETIGPWRREGAERHGLLPTTPFSLTSTGAEEAL